VLILKWFESEALFVLFVCLFFFFGVFPCKVRERNWPLKLEIDGVMIKLFIRGIDRLVAIVTNIVGKGWALLHLKKMVGK